MIDPFSTEEEQPKKGPSPLLSLEADLKIYREPIREVAEEILREQFSRYPIFVAHQHEVKLGELILDKSELKTNWSIQASTLEEFVEKGIIQRERQELFENNYKDPKQFMCLFVVVPEGANFVFYPY
ncbi:hypothetical protein [Solitalea koreensis]|uniref:Uncharacterized protein n=1 Tax=Solitalea koreensis TaxID=543615 RepID=A0A521CIQ2_9SPHI|nr:hypothetical protein [Solitalea koreensis]SMO59272.1 hypothetical protein SAMN06265350_10490 [Solitalea koreensis]